MLAVLTCHFTLGGFRNPQDNYLRTMEDFRRQAPEEHVYSVELVHGDGPALDPHAIRLQAGEQHRWLWQKENLLTYLVSILPPQYDKILIADADCIYLRPDWYQATEAALDHCDVMQNWERCHWTSRVGGIAKSADSVTKHQRFPDFPRTHPGFNWAFRREVFERLGLFRVNPVGSGDSILAWAMFGDGPPTQAFRTFAKGSYYDPFRDQYQRAHLRYGFLPGHIVHRWHGELKDRQYATRYKYLLECGFDPSHVQLDKNGLLSWSTAAPQTVIKAFQYHALRRREDG